MPSDWRPSQVRNPATGEYFTKVEAWEFVADLLEAGHEVETIELEQPPGRVGFVMIVPGRPLPIYVKLQLGAGKIIGRSFHFSERP